MNTAFLLMAQFERATVPLAEIAEEYLGMTAPVAQREALMHNLPIPTFRLRDSNKSPLLVHIDDLAAHIDQARAKAKKAWDKSQL